MEFIAGLGLLFVLSFVGSGPFPVPVTILVFWLGQFDQPWLVVLVALAGTLLGWVALHRFLKALLVKRGGMDKKIPAAYRRYLLQHTGLSLFMFNAALLPWEPVRFLALLNNYPMGRLLLFYGLGRIVRYTLLVVMGAVLAPYQKLFWGMLALLLLLPFVLDRVLRLWRKPQAAHVEVPDLQEKAESAQSA